MKLFSLLLGAALVSGAAAAGCTPCPANALTCAASATGTLTAITCKDGFFAKADKSACTACSRSTVTATCSSATLDLTCKATLATATGVYLDKVSATAATCKTCGLRVKSCVDFSAENVGTAVKGAVCLPGNVANVATAAAATCAACTATGGVTGFLLITCTAADTAKATSATCKPGYAKDATVATDQKCIECTGAKFGSAGAADGGALCVKSANAATLAVPTKCTAGYYLDSATCTKCEAPTSGVTAPKGFVSMITGGAKTHIELCPAGTDGYSTATAQVAVGAATPCPNLDSKLTTGACTACHELHAFECTTAAAGQAKKCVAGRAVVAGACDTAAFTCPTVAECGASIGAVAIAKIYTMGNAVGQLTVKTGCTMIAGATCTSTGVTTEAKSYALTCAAGTTKTALAACPAGWYKKLTADVPDAVTCMADCDAVKAADGPCMCGTAECVKLDTCAAADKTANKCKKPVQATKKSPASTMQASALLSAAALLVAMRQ